MEQLIILLVVFVLTLAVSYLFRRKRNVLFAGKLSLSVMFLFTGISHFVWARGMAMMLPEWIWFRSLIVYVTGFIEIIFALAIWSEYHKRTGWLIILFLIAVLPANVYATYHQVNIISVGYDGEDLYTLFYRIPIQCCFMGWTYYFLIK